MTDDLDKLRAALKAAPDPDAGAKARALRLAMENFDRHQGQRQGRAGPARPMSDRPHRGGFLTGVREMLSTLTSRSALAATASIAAIGVAIAVWPAIERQANLPAPSPGIGANAPQPGAETDLAAGQQAPAVSNAKRAEAPALAQTGAQDAVAEGVVAEEAASSIVTGAPASAPMPEPEALSMPAPGVAFDALGGTVAREALSAAPQDAQSYPADLRAKPAEPDTEAFANATPNPVKIVAEEPVSTFSIDADTASWSVVRSSLLAGHLPPKEAVRVEEMVNYFPYAYPAPTPGEAPFRASVGLFQTPWNADTQILRIGLQGALPATDDRPPLNLVFLIDTSGSMDDPQKLPLLKQSFRLLVGRLQPADRVAIVTYAGSAGLVLDATPASDSATILAALDRLGAGGSTAGQEGLQQAYQVAESMAAEGGVGRIVLATDGDFNLGIQDPAALEDYIATKRAGGIYLSVLGFGRGNLDDAVMQALAQNGNGTAAYIDTLSEAQKVMVDQGAGALFPIADDVKIQIEFNPAAVAEYRLIGYETRALAREDFNNDRVDAGEIGAGHQVTALYEVTPVGSPAQLSDPLRYAAEQTALAGDAGELGFLKLRYKLPGAESSTLIETPIPAMPVAPDADAAFAAAIAGMGQLLSEPKYLGGWGWDEAIALAGSARGDDPFGYRSEAVQLMRLAQSLSAN